MHKLTLPTLGLALLLGLAITASVGAVRERTITGSARADVLHGTPGADRILGLGGNDRLYGLGGADEILGGSGEDSLSGGPGNDMLLAGDRARDLVTCGTGRDVAVVDDLDQVDASCEVVSHIAESEDPIPLGMPAEIGNGWTVEVLVATPNATGRIVHWAIGNEPPAPGHQYFMASVRARRSGTGPGYFRARFRLQATGPSGTKYTAGTCGVIPDPNLELDDPLVFPGSTVQGNVCWSVTAFDAWNLVMYASDGRRVFFALTP